MSKPYRDNLLYLLNIGKKEGIGLSYNRGNTLQYSEGKPVTETQRKVALEYESCVAAHSEAHGMSRREFIRSPLAFAAGVMALSSVLGISVIPSRVRAAQNPLLSKGGNQIPGIGRIDFANPLVPIPDFDTNPAYAKVPVEGKVAIVTGASTGIGRGAALSLKQRGFHVIGTSRRPHAALQPPAIDGLWQLDLANPLSIAHFIKKVKAELGTLDLLVMNAGRYIFGRMRNISLHKSRLLYQTNVWGHHQLFQELSPLFPAEGYARVMLTSSSSDPGYMGYYGDPTTGVGMWSSATQPYTASKAALARLGANIWADQQQNATIGDQSNICVTVLYPPSVNTRLNDNAIIADDPNHPLVSSAIETNTTFLTYLGLNPLLAGEAYGQMAEMAEPFLDAYIYDVTLDPENDPRDIPQFFMQQILIDLNVQQRKRTFRSLE